MRLMIAADAMAMGQWVAEQAAEQLRAAIDQQGSATMIVATGASQFQVLGALVHKDIDWNRVTAFHLDEYVGLSPDHHASFCKYLDDRFVSKVPLAAFHYLRGDDPVETTIREVGDLLRRHQVDVALVGIGENGHLAFNDPPADFQTDDPYIVVELDQACRAQQVGEGWFASLDDVPTRAISMSVRQILKSRTIFCSVPDARKAAAVRATVEGPVTPDVPASILQTHDAAVLVIDREAASQLGDHARQHADVIG